VGGVPSSEPGRAGGSGLGHLLKVNAGRAAHGAVRPLRRMWRSPDAIDGFGLVHFTSVAGDTLLAISLADSVFFSLPVGQARGHVAAYLFLTMLPLALAGPLLVPILDRAGPRRIVTFLAAAGRAVLAWYLASRVDTLLLFAFALGILVLSRIHAITKNGLTLAYAAPDEGLMRVNARLGRVAVAGALVAGPIGFASVKLFGGAGPLYLAVIAYAAAAALTTRLPDPGRAEREVAPVGRRGRIPQLTGPAMGAIGMRAAGGYLLFLLAFSLRNREVDALWLAVIGAAGIIGAFVADLVAPRVPTQTREEAVVIACVSAAGVSALLAAQLFGLPLLAVYAFLAGAGTEFARLAFQSLMQRNAPPGALGRVFVRYEVLFQLGWIAGAFLPVVVPIPFRLGILLLASFFLGVALVYWWRFRQGIDRDPPG
jgi:hypothetical protein